MSPSSKAGAGASAVPRRSVDGVLLLDKPGGMTSNGALQQAKRLFRAEKAGHTGTLDPMATGLLPLCFGEATKFAQALLDGDKTYLATVALGVTTDTGDADGQEISRREVAVTEADVQRVLAGMLGPQMQVPPQYSALKHKGRALYDYARAGIEVPRPPRPIEIHELQLEARSSAELVVRVRCSKGTYVRVLAENIGEALGCGAHLAGLRRIATGSFSLAAAHGFDALAQMSEAERDALLLPADSLLAALPRIDLASEQAVRLLQGQAVRVAGLGDGPWRAYDEQAFVGVVDALDGSLRPRRLMARAASRGEMLVA